MKCQCGYEYQYELVHGDHHELHLETIKGDQEFLVLEPCLSVWGTRGKTKGEMVACPKCRLVYFVETFPDGYRSLD